MPENNNSAKIQIRRIKQPEKSWRKPVKRILAVVLVVVVLIVVGVGLYQKSNRSGAYGEIGDPAYENSEYFEYSEY